MSGQTETRADIALPGGDLAEFSGTTLGGYGHADALGSIRAESTPLQKLAAYVAFTPFGEDETSTSGASRIFTGQHQDLSPTTDAGQGQYDFLYREFSPVQARWWTPDPLGAAAANPNDPQSWNEYAYVRGTPLTSTDPLGLFCPYGGGCTAMDAATGGWEGDALGGGWNEFTIMSIPVTTDEIGYGWFPIKASTQDLPPFAVPNGIGFPTLTPTAAYISYIEILNDGLDILDALQRAVPIAQPRLTGPNGPLPLVLAKETPKSGLFSCTFTGSVGARWGETALDAAGAFPGGGAVVRTIQFGAAITAAAASTFGDETGAGLAGAGAGLVLADRTGATIMLHGVEVTPVVGNIISLTAAVHDLTGSDGLLAAYRGCMARGH